MAGVYEPSNNCEGTLALQQEDIDSQESDSEIEGPDIDTDTSPTSHTVLQRGPSSRYRQSAYAETSPLDFLRLLIDREYAFSKLRKALQFTQRRTEHAERQLAEHVRGFQSLYEDRARAERKLKGWLSLYKVQYDLAQKEIEMAREEVMGLWDQVERARRDATKAKEELETGAEGKWLELGKWWTRAKEGSGISAANMSQSDPFARKARPAESNAGKLLFPLPYPVSSQREAEGTPASASIFIPPPLQPLPPPPNRILMFRR
ncbi:hypothetical protein GYMLUDRAFT_250633 [Collybiopsis luxurians FD-317 M1]|uniref:Uncharacterized protein n=1 Tax=Collybiopsis luxurians FD-317 M1 TaxID=944289 RepID=A0A0D0BUD8_9AGAR|nr:hypothetical protein GYMLUDRAFT_250633 [Collybiopsis luxurians FD-317 M1]